MKYPEDFGREKFVYTAELEAEFESINPDIEEWVHSCEFVNGFKKETVHILDYSPPLKSRREEIKSILKSLWTDETGVNDFSKIFKNDFGFDHHEFTHEYYQYLSKIIIQLVKPNSFYDDTCKYWKMVHDVDMLNFRYFVFISFKNKYPWSYVKDIVEKYYETNQNFHWTNYVELMNSFPCEISSDTNVIDEWCKQAILDNPKVSADYQKGKLNALNSLKGQVMKLSKGKADINMVGETLQKLLKSS